MKITTVIANTDIIGNFIFSPWQINANLKSDTSDTIDTIFQVKAIGVNTL